jgi:hypothetical protein
VSDPYEPDLYARFGVRPGDILLTRHSNWRTRAGIAGWLIRLGARLLGTPDTVDHVIIAHHLDLAGTYWGIQGQPGVVSQVDIAPALADRNTITNALQPKTTLQRQMVCATAEAMYTGKVPYDWPAIAVDTANVVLHHVAPLWRSKDQWGGQVPAHVVCSSAADFAYERAGLASPKPDRWCTPGDWAKFIAEQAWLKVNAA